MTPVEELIKAKLAEALEAEKKRIASSLVKEAISGIRVKTTGTAGNMQHRREKKMLQIQKLQGQLQTQTATAAGNTNPLAARKRQERMGIQRQKLTLAQSELAAMHEAE